MKNIFFGRFFPSLQQNKKESQTHEHIHETSWEPAISGFGAASHDHGAHQSGNSTRLISRIADKIKSVDGIDETASLTGQILPGIAGAIATATILGAATPFVWLGVLGMKEEYETACEEFNEIIHRTMDVEARIREMTFFAQSKRQILKEKFSLELEENPDPSLQNMGSILGLAHYAAEYQTLENKRLIAALGKRFGWTGLVGMSGMFAGMLPATAAAGLGIAHEISAGIALESAATALEIASGSCFLVGQAAMTIYATNRGYQGLKAKEILEKSKQIFSSHCSSLSSASHILQIIDAQIKFIEKHSIEYAKLTVGGQGVMIAGTVAGMTGVGLVATVPLFGVGASLTIGGALQRIYYQGREKKFKGRNSPFTDEIIAEVSPITLFTRFFEDAVSQTDIADYSDENILKTLDKKVLATLDKKFDEVTTQLAAVKCYSLLHHVVNSKRTPEQKIRYLETRMHYVLDGFRNTGLEKAVLEKMRVFYHANKESFTALLSSAEANRTIAEKVQEILKTSPEKLGLNADFFEHPIDKDLSRKIIATAKSSLKSARFFTADSIVRVAQTIEARKILGLNAEGRNFNENYTAQYLFGTDTAAHSHGGIPCCTSHNREGASAGKKAQLYASACAIPPLVSQSCGDVSCRITHNPLEAPMGDETQLYASTCAAPVKRRKKKRIAEIRTPEDSVAQPDPALSEKENIQPLEKGAIPAVKTQETRPLEGGVYKHTIDRSLQKSPLQYPRLHKTGNIVPVESSSTTVNSQLISKKEAGTIARALLEKQPLPGSYVEFKEIVRTTQKDGSVHIIYQDPFDKSSDKHIHYLIDIRGKLTVQHGCAASAIIPVNRQSGYKTTGIEIHTICNGKYEGGSSKQPIAHYGAGESLLQAVLQLQKTAHISRDLPHWQKHVRTSQLEKALMMTSTTPAWHH